MLSEFGAVGTRESVKSELSFFDDHSYQVTHLRGQHLRVRPNNQYQGCDGNQIQFKIPQSTGWYLDWNDSYMVVKVRILDKDANVLRGGEIVAFENNVIATLFKDVSFQTSQQTKLEGENGNYAYKSYIYCMLNASKAAKQYQLGVTGWMHDTAGQYDTQYVKEVKTADNPPKITTAFAGSKGFETRMKWTDKSNPVQFAGPVYLDLWLQPQHFMDGQDYFVTFKPNTPKFMLHANVDTDEYKVDIMDAYLQIRQVNVAADVISGHMEGLKKYNYVCPYNGHKIYTKLITQGLSEDSITNLFEGVFPKLVIIGLLDHEAFAGKYSKSPFNFQHFDVNYIGISFNGNPIPQPAFTPDHEKGHIANEYLSLFMALGKSGIMGDDNGILMEDFSRGCCFYTFNFAPDMCLSGHAQPARFSPLALDIRFAKPTPRPITLLGLAVYDTKVEMTKDKVWILDTTQSQN